MVSRNFGKKRYSTLTVLVMFPKIPSEIQLKKNTSPSETGIQAFIGVLTKIPQGSALDFQNIHLHDLAVGMCPVHVLCSIMPCLHTWQVAGSGTYA